MRQWTGDLDKVGWELLDSGSLVEVPTWQALDVRDKPQGTTFELTDYTFGMRIPHDQWELQRLVEANQPFAEAQFQDRVSGEPLNPPPSHELWPWAKHNAEHQKQERFSHSYPERYWPADSNPLGADGIRRGYPSNTSQFGDLGDVINLLAREPTTRQAYLPMFFPFDTGAVHGERIPCSLGYLFLMREGKLNITYYIRSCDFYRHFRDDVYMTARLCQWVLEQLKPDELNLNDSPWDSVTPGRLTMHIGSLHIFEGDLPRLRREYGSD